MMKKIAIKTLIVVTALTMSSAVFAAESRPSCSAQSLSTTVAHNDQADPAPTTKIPKAGKAD